LKLRAYTSAGSGTLLKFQIREAKQKLDMSM